MLKYIFILMMLFASPVWAVDSELKDLTEVTNADGTYLMYTTTALGASRYSTLANLLTDANLPNDLTINSTKTITTTANVGVGSTSPRAKLDVDGAIYATSYYGSGANLTDLPASMTYPSGDGVAVVSGGSSWGTTLSTDGSGACSSGAVCLGDHTHASLSADIALGTNTSGNYVNGATATGGLTLTGTEGATLGITPCTGNENYIMKWNAATGWTCQADAAAASGLAATDIDTSSELATIMTDEVGTGFYVLNASPYFTGNVGIGTSVPLSALSVVGNTNISGAITSADYLQLDIAFTDGSAEGRLQWNATDGVPEVGLPGGNVNLQIGQEMLIKVKEAAGQTITNGEVVYISGATGSIPEVSEADADAANTSKVLGVATETIGTTGYVTTTGLVRGVNTDGMTEGAVLWLSQTAGAFTTTKPAIPASGIAIGYVVTAHASTGVIYVGQNIYPASSWLSDLSTKEYTAYNVGIGSTNPTQKLDVIGTVKATAFSGPLTGAVTGNASTATALAADPANCASSGLAGGINASGVAEGCVTPNAGTNIANDLEEEVTEGSLADSTIVSADIKDGTIASADIGTLTNLTASGLVSMGTATVTTTLAVSGNVGIGTTDVSRRLTIVGAGNVGINSASPTSQLAIDGTIYLKNLTAGGSHGAAKALCWGLDGTIYSISSGSCY